MPYPRFLNDHISTALKGTHLSVETRSVEPRGYDYVSAIKEWECHTDVNQLLAAGVMREPARDHEPDGHTGLGSGSEYPQR